MMPRRVPSLLLVPLLALMLAGPAQAECYADYKAKQDDPLRLHYGVAQVSGRRLRQAQAAEGRACRPTGGRWLDFAEDSLHLWPGRSGRKESECRRILPPLLTV